MGGSHTHGHGHSASHVSLRVRVKVRVPRSALPPEIIFVDNEVQNVTDLQSGLTIAKKLKIPLRCYCFAPQSEAELASQVLLETQKAAANAEAEAAQDASAATAGEGESDGEMDISMRQERFRIDIASQHSRTQEAESTSPMQSPNTAAIASALGLARLGSPLRVEDTAPSAAVGSASGSNATSPSNAAGAGIYGFMLALGNVSPSTTSATAGSVSFATFTSPTSNAASASAVAMSTPLSASSSRSARRASAETPHSSGVPAFHLPSHAETSEAEEAEAELDRDADAEAVDEDAQSGVSEEETDEDLFHEESGLETFGHASTRANFAPTSKQNAQLYDDDAIEEEEVAAQGNQDDANVEAAQNILAALSLASAAPLGVDAEIESTASLSAPSLARQTAAAIRAASRRSTPMSMSTSRPTPMHRLNTPIRPRRTAAARVLRQRETMHAGEDTHSRRVPEAQQAAKLVAPRRRVPRAARAAAAPRSHPSRLPSFARS
jgi:hypothetical protein